MAVEVGSTLEGQVTGIVKFGAFVKLSENMAGLVHISEIANEYVSDNNDFLKVGDKVQVKVISIDEHGKVALSIKQAISTTAHHEKKKSIGLVRESLSMDKSHFSNKERNGSNFRRNQHRNDSGSFEDKLNRFLKDSGERLLDLKRNVESKRGGRGSRWSD